MAAWTVFSMVLKLGNKEIWSSVFCGAICVGVITVSADWARENPSCLTINPEDYVVLDFVIIFLGKTRYATRCNIFALIRYWLMVVNPLSQDILFYFDVHVVASFRASINVRFMT